MFNGGMLINPQVTTQKNIEAGHSKFEHLRKRPPVMQCLKKRKLQQLIAFVNHAVIKRL